MENCAIALPSVLNKKFIFRSCRIVREGRNANKGNRAKDVSINRFFWYASVNHRVIDCSRHINTMSVEGVEGETAD